MPVFSENDFGTINRSQAEMPDGLVDGGRYFEVFKSLAKELGSLDIEDYESKIQFMMNIVNPIYVDDEGENIDKSYVFDLITCLSFHVIQLLVTSSDFVEDFKNKYIDIIESDIMPSLENECKALPYWT